MGKRYGVLTWQTSTEPVTLSHLGLSERLGELKYLDFDVAETWLLQTLSRPPDLGMQPQVSTVYHVTATEIRENPQLSAGAYDFRGTALWFGVGTQDLAAVGQRPDSVLEVEANVVKSLPPRNRRGFLC